jgi:dCMP deaminase
MINTHCERIVHAEANACAQAARNGVCTDGATAYISAHPCWSCFKLLAQAGIKRIVYLESYRPDENVTKTAAEIGMIIEQLNN